MKISKEEALKAFEECKTKKEICERFNNKSSITRFVERLAKIADVNVDDYFKSKTNIEEKICLCCGKKIEGKYWKDKKFCNSSCAAKYNNSHRKHSEETKNKLSKTIASKHPLFDEDIYNKKRENTLLKQKLFLKKEENNTIKYFCLNCGKEIVEFSKSKRFFCSHSCQTEYKKTNYLERWKNGEENGLKGEYGLSSFIRNYLLEKHNYKCELCGWGETNPYTNKIPLEIHHKDGDYRNNTEENLQVLCPCCHSLTESFKAHNKNGRKGRTKYK